MLHDPATQAEQGEITIIAVWPPAMYLREHVGEAALQGVARTAELSVADIEERKRWISFRQLRLFLGATRELLADELTYQRACVYRFDETYPRIKFVMVGASNPRTMLKLALNNVHLNISPAIVSCQVIEESRDTLRWRYVNKRREDETRELCTSRKTTFAHMSTFWGLPPAQVQEHACMANGDAYCEYEFRWVAFRRRLPAVVGLGVGAASGAALWTLQLATPVGWVSLGLLGVLVGQLLELGRVTRQNLNDSVQAREALELVARDELEARRELLAMHERQQQWNRALEQRLSESVDTTHRTVEQIKRWGELRQSAVRGFSHDLRNPLALLRQCADYVRRHGSKFARGEEVADDLTYGVTQIDHLLREFVSSIGMPRDFVKVVRANLDTHGLADKLARRARALVHGRDVGVSSAQAADLPPSIETDPLIFDRVLDNLLTNAAKATERGSIRVSLQAEPGHLVVEIGDTGPGMHVDELQRAFARGQVVPSRANGTGVGLSVVGDLLRCIGGFLEVESRLGEGTLFRVHFPVQLRAGDQAAAAAEDARQPAGGFEEVVVIRE